MSGYDVSVLPLIPSDGDISNLHGYLHGPSASLAGSKSPPGDLSSDLDGRISGSRSREALYALRNPKKLGTRAMASPSTRSAPSSLYHYGMPRNFSTPSLRGVKSVSPVPMSYPRPHTVTSHRMAPSPTGVRDDSQTTPTLLPKKIRKSRSASILSLRKSGNKKGSSAAGSVPLPEAARTSPTPVSALGLYRHGSTQADNSFSTLDLQESVDNDSSTMMTLQGDLSREIPESPQSMAPSLPQPLSTTSWSANEIQTKTPASADAQESLKILSEVEQPWFHPPAPPPLPSNLASLAPPLTERRLDSVQNTSSKALPSEIKQPEPAIKLPLQVAPVTPDRLGASANRSEATDHVGDVSGHASDAGVNLRPSMVSVEYSPASRYSGISLRSPPVTDVLSFSPAASYATPPLPQNELPNKSPVMPQEAPMGTNNSSLQSLWSNNGPPTTLSTSQDFHGSIFDPKPAVHAHTLSSNTPAPRFTYSIVNGIQPKAHQPQVKNNMSLDTKPLPPAEPPQTCVPASHNEETPETPHAEERSSPPLPILPNVAEPRVPSNPLPAIEEHTWASLGSMYYGVSNDWRNDPQGLREGIDADPATVPKLEDKFEDLSVALDPMGDARKEGDETQASMSSDTRKVASPVEAQQPFKSDTDESLSLRLKEFQSQHQALRGTIESSRAEILQLRERIRAFRAEVDDGVLMQPQPEPANPSIYKPASPKPPRSDRLRDSLVSMDDLDRRLTLMLETHGSGNQRP